MVSFKKRNIQDLLQRGETSKYLFNTSWMLSEKLITMGLSLFMSIFVARYLGAEMFGILSYALSLSSLFAVATHLGLQGLVVRELVNQSDQSGEILGTTLGMKYIGAFLALIAFFIISFTSSNNTTELRILLIFSGTILFKPFEVFDFFFQANVQAKYSSVVRLSSTVFVSVMKIMFIVAGLSVIFFAFGYLIQSIFTVILFFICFKWKINSKHHQWQFNWQRAAKLFRQGWIIMLAAIFSMVYLKMDQVMLRWMVGIKEVGIYSVAARISEAWYFIPTTIVASLFPKLIDIRASNMKNYKIKFQQLYNLLFIIAFVIALALTFSSSFLISLLFGDEYITASLILSIHIWAGVFIFMRAAFSKWILIENAISFSLITQGIGAVVNILLNFILIPKYQGVGAAVATIISYASASYFSLLFYKKTRSNFWMMSKAFLSPFYITKNLLSKHCTK